MVTPTTPRPPLRYLLIRRLTLGLAVLAAGGNVYRHQYYLAGVWAIISLNLLLSKVGPRLPAASLRWLLASAALSWLVAVGLLVLFGQS